MELNQTYSSNKHFSEYITHNMAAKSSRHQYRYGATSRHGRPIYDTMLVMAQVRDWLAQTFTRHTAGGASKHLSSTTPRFRSVANAIRAGILVDRYVSSGLLDKAVKEFKRKAVTSDYSESILKPRLHRDTILSKSSSQTEAKKGSPYSITERRVPELIPVLGSEPASDVSHKPGGRLPLLSSRPAVTPATRKRSTTNFAA